jgi:hypothetical protein
MSLAITQLIGFGAVQVSSGVVADGVNRLPDMTAATTSGVTITCSDPNGFGYDAWKGADRDNSTNFLNANNNTAYTYHVDFGSGNAQIIQSYTMTELSAAEYLSTRYPNSFTFEASADNSSWTTLDTQSTTSVGAGNKRTFPITNQTSYRYYRFSVAGRSGNIVGWAECELLS